METPHTPTAFPDRIDIEPADDPIGRALRELARAGIGFEIVAGHDSLEAAA